MIKLSYLIEASLEIVAKQLRQINPKTSNKNKNKNKVGLRLIRIEADQSLALVLADLGIRTRLFAFLSRK